MKPTEPVREQLRRMWLFSELSDAELDMIAQIAMRRQHDGVNADGTGSDPAVVRRRSRVRKRRIRCEFRASVNRAG